MEFSGPRIVAMVCVVLNVAAFAYWLLGRRAVRPRRLAWRTAICALLVALALPVSYVLRMSEVFQAVADTDPAQKSSVLAVGISDAMSSTAYLAVALVVPLLTTMGLWRRGQGAAGTASVSPGPASHPAGG